MASLESSSYSILTSFPSLSRDRLILTRPSMSGLMPDRISSASSAKESTNSSYPTKQSRVPSS